MTLQRTRLKLRILGGSSARASRLLPSERNELREHVT
jgi:hypothetical protein